MASASPSPTRWFYVKGGRRQGPVEASRLVDMILAQELPEDTLVWHAGLAGWVKAREAEEIRSELPPPVPEELRAPEEPPAAPAGGEAAPPLPDEAPAPDAGPGAGSGPAELPAEAGSDLRRRRRRHRHHRHRVVSQQPWLLPLLFALIGLMVGLWWLLRRMNEVPPGRIIQTGEAICGTLEPGMRS